MGPSVAWALLLLPALLPPAWLGSRDLSCPVLLGDVDWSRGFNASCLNLSGGGLHLPENLTLPAGTLLVLDLSGNSLQRLPAALFEGLTQLRVLRVMDNPLSSVDGMLATHCQLDLQAHCSCALAPWHHARRTHCLGQQPLQCLHRGTGAWQNLSVFLDANCAPGLGTAGVGALAAGGALLALLLAAGVALTWGRWRHHVTPDRGKAAAGARDPPQPGTSCQPRYSSRGPGPANPAPMSAAPDYENVFLGWPLDRIPPAEDTDYYVNYRGAPPDSQAIYGNL